MFHSKERAEKICLNCGTELHGRYCHKCGQENVEPKHSLWGLITHFFNDITHFDGKFFVTVKYLVRRPGFLPKEYNSGRRASYLDPIRMYVFTSALFFLIFYSVFDDLSLTPTTADSDVNHKTSSVKPRKKLSEALKSTDTADVDYQVDTMDISKVLETDRYATVDAYDSAQALLPKEKRDPWAAKVVKHRLIKFASRYGEATGEEIKRALIEKFLHSLPSLLFISLPLYALYLKLLYIRNRRINYVEHTIFLVYLYIFTFIFFLVFFGLQATRSHWWDSRWLTLLEFLLFIYGVIYTMAAMRRFYDQGRLKTFIKFIIMNVLTVISLVILAILFFGLAFYRL